MAKRRYIVGIDPGVQTGVAIYDRIGSEIIHFCTKDFVTTQDFLISMFSDRGEVAVYVEVPPEFMYGRNKKKFGKDPRQITLSDLNLRKLGITAHELAGREEVSEAVRDDAAFKIGGNRREAQLLSKMLQKLGFYVKEIPPVPETKWTQEKFTLRTRLKTQTNQHERDAVRIALYYK